VQVASKNNVQVVYLHKRLTTSGILKDFSKEMRLVTETNVVIEQK
jgi:hypothetical protein